MHVLAASCVSPASAQSPWPQQFRPRRRHQQRGGLHEPAEDSRETFRTSSSGILSEANFTRDEQGRIATTLPWIAGVFFGPNEIAVHAVDDNLFDIVRSQQTQSPGGQGGDLGPGELPNVIEYVEGGTGVLGSYVRARRAITIERPVGR